MYKINTDTWKRYGEFKNEELVWSYTILRNVQVSVCLLCQNEDLRPPCIKSILNISRIQRIIGCVLHTFTIGVELGVASWQPPHPKNFRPTRNVCRPSRNLLTWMASMNFGGQKFQNFCLKAENFEKFLDFGFREGGGYSLYAVRPTRSHMNSTPMTFTICF